VEGLFVIPAILDVLPEPEILVTTTPLRFRAVAGDPAPAPQILYVTAKNKAISFTAVTSGGNWLQVTPTSANTPANLSVSANPAGLTPGTYEGVVSIRSAAAINSPQDIRVTLDVTGLVPGFPAAGVVNAASYQAGAISPGEAITFFGTNIGPEQAAGAEVGADGKLSTRVANTRILFDGVAAPLLSVSSRQSSCMTPYSVGAKQSVTVEIEYQGAKSAPAVVQVTQTRPGVFTANASGTGQGAVLNQNLSANSAQNPADRGSVVVIYLTGAGETAPAGADGVLNSAQRLPVPLLPVSVRIGGQTAVVEFYGGAPGLVAGIIQVNARMGSEVTPGPAVPVEVQVGESRSQAGVTVAVR
jgi:uncharacterized protein (TIGR03437 family)